jgi:hypothetical protein
MSTSHCTLLNHAHIGDQHIPSFIDSIHLVLQDCEHVTLHTPQSCPRWRSTHPFLCWFDSPSTTRLWKRDVSYSSIIPTLEINTSPFLRRFDSLRTKRIWARHVAYSSIMPTLETNTSLPSSIRFLVLQNCEHVTLHTTRSCPHWRSTQPFLRRFDLLSTTRLWALNVAYSSIMPTLDINTSLPLSIRFLVLQDYQHVMLHTPRS